MLTLALDTALERTALALSDGARRAHALVVPMERGHAERLMPLVSELFAAAGATPGEVGRIAVDVGPGSFTGIRIAVAAARGLGVALGVPVVGIDSLTLIARSLAEPPAGPVLAVIDARRGELYAALHGADGRRLAGPIAADAATVWDAYGAGAAVIAGSGAAILAHHAAVAGHAVPPVEAAAAPDPLVLARLAILADPAAFPPSPVYVRPPDAKPQSPMSGLLK